jgi:SOS response regulatory protein OraA/RecX
VARRPANRIGTEDSELHKALLKKAGDLLARRAYSRGELQTRLLKIAGKSVVDATLDRLQQLNLLNDGDYAYNFALYRIKHEGWGPAKVRSSLAGHQVAAGDIEIAMERVRSTLGGELDLVKYMQKYCGKSWPPMDAKSLQRLIMHLRRRGFDEENIYSALKKGIPEAVLQRFEMGE